MNKIAVITMVKNEEDVIESFARHACKIADVVLVANHNSTDKTRHILESLQNEGLPIKIYDLHENTYDHAKILTEFLHRAIDEEHADLIIPLDADEFLIKPNGNSDDARKYFQQLDPEKSYQMKWVFYELEDPEKDQDKFILSRPCRRESANGGVRKCCVGAVAAKKHQLKILKGGHITLYSNDVDFPQTYIGEEIFNAHFPKRSAGQILSKGMGGWLGHLLKFGRYGWLSIDWKTDVDNYIDDDILPEFHLKNSTPTNDFEQYRSECENRYSTGKIDPLKNVYRIAEQIAIENFQFKILEHRELVRIYVLFDGNVDECLKSLDSAINQTYPVRKIFVVATTEKNLDELVKIISNKNFSEEIELISAEDPSIFSDDNGFIQFITSGDILQPEKIFESIEAMYSDRFDHNLVVCLDEKQVPSFAPIKYVISDSTLCLPLRAELVFNTLLKLDACFSAGLSGFLFRAKALKNAVDLVPWLSTSNVDAFQFFFYTIAVEFQPTFLFLKKSFVKKNRVWTEKDRLMFEKTRAMFAMKIRGKEFFSEDDYQRVRKDLHEKFGIELTE